MLQKVLSQACEDSTLRCWFCGTKLTASSTRDVPVVRQATSSSGPWLEIFVLYRRVHPGSWGTVYLHTRSSQ